MFNNLVQLGWSVDQAPLRGVTISILQHLFSFTRLLKLSLESVVLLDSGNFETGWEERELGLSKDAWVHSLVVFHWRV